MSTILVIGGGITGLSTAYYLRRAGHEVTIIDKGDLSDNCSSGNAGMIVPSHFVPLAAPGMVSQGIRWMFNSKSPFYVKPSLNKELIGWGIKFLKSANSKHVERSAVPLRDLSLISKQLYSELHTSGLDFGLTENGILAFYKTEKAAEEEAHLAEKGRSLGLDMEVLSAAACKALQPGLDIDVMGAVHYRCDAHLYPNKLISGLVNYMKENNVPIYIGREVTEIEHDGKRITSLSTGAVRFAADQYVIAGGSWSPAIARMVKLNIPLIPGKGYSFMEPDKDQQMTIPALLCEARVAVTPMNGQIRFGGTMELDKINSRVNMQRVQGIVDAVPAYFPGIKPKLPTQENIWYGFRPASPDGLPYIGRTRRYNNLIVATGHGMMGLSLGPATGKIVSELVDERQPAMDISAFSPDRF